MPSVKETEEQSLYVFRFRLFPAYACRTLYWEIELPEAHVACSRDILSVVVRSERIDVRPLLLAAKRIGGMVLDAHAFLGYPTDDALELQSEGWVELVAGAGHRIMVGYSDQSIAADPLDFSSDKNTPFSSPPSYWISLGRADGLGAALADFRATRRASSDYVGIYAYRVLENIATSVSGTIEPDKRKHAWAEMHRLFGTTREQFDPVEQASKASRHGNPLAGVSIDEFEAGKLVALAKLGIDQWLAYIDMQDTSAATK
jgi:hypothetical protein